MLVFIVCVLVLLVAFPENFLAVAIGGVTWTNPVRIPGFVSVVIFILGGIGAVVIFGHLKGESSSGHPHHSDHIIMRELGDILVVD